MIVLARFWPLVLVAALFLGVLGMWFAARQQPVYATSALLVVEDARSRLFDRPTTDIERYVATQAAVIGSEPVAEAASEALTAANNGVSITPGELLAGVTVTVEDGADVISVRFRADDADEARQGATAVLRAYEGLVESSIQADLAAARDRLDTEIDDVRQALRTTRQSIESQRSVATSDVEGVVASSSAALADAADRRSSVDTFERIAAELDALRSLSAFEERDPRLAAALQTHQELELVLAELSDRRADLAARGSLVGSGVAFSTEAERGRPNRFSTTASGLLAALLGAGLGAALAYVAVAWDVTPPWRRAPERGDEADSAPQEHEDGNGTSARTSDSPGGPGSPGDDTGAGPGAPGPG